MITRRKDHFLLCQMANWRAALLRHINVDETAETLSLAKAPGTGKPLVDAAGTFGGLSLPTAIAVAPDDSIYILDGAAHALKRYDPCLETFETLPCIAAEGTRPRQFIDPHGIAISCKNDLYVADSGNRRVQIFALKGLPLRRILGPFVVDRTQSGVNIVPVPAKARSVSMQDDCIPPSGFPTNTWLPWDIVISKSLRLYISDYANGLIHIFDRQGVWTGAIEGESPAQPLVKPTHLALDKHGRLCVVQEGTNTVAVFEPGGQFIRNIGIVDEARAEFFPHKIGIDSNGNIYISERFARRVARVDVCAEAGCAVARPLRQFPGECASIAFTQRGEPIFGDERNHCVTLLPHSPTFETDGTFISEPLDSKIYECRWHRVALEATTPLGSQIQIDTFTSESPKSLAEIDDLPESRWGTRQFHSDVPTGKWDCLVSSPRGRYLWLRLKLRGDGAATPTIQSARIYSPRQSSMRFLPAVFHEDATGTDFLARFLSIFDSVRGQTDDLLRNLSTYFDPRSTPLEALDRNGIDFLTWLGGWMGLAVEQHWPEEKRRELVRNAHLLHKWRGAAKGVALHLKLYTGMEPRILEHFRLRRWLSLNHTRLGDTSALFCAAIVRRLQLDEFASIGSFRLQDSGDPAVDPFNHYAHQFTVFVPARRDYTGLERQTIHRIVEMAKPAHTLAHVRILEPRYRIGSQAIIGMSTVLSPLPRATAVCEGKLGNDTLIGPSEDERFAPWLRIGQRSRIGADTRLN